MSSGERAPYAGHADFHISKLYSARHRLTDVVREFLESKDAPELFRKFVNTGWAETWRQETENGLDATGLAVRCETYGPGDLPIAVKCISGFGDTQDDRLEILFMGWGEDEESWAIQYEIINLDSAQPRAWIELDALISRTFRRRGGSLLRCAAFGIDAGGHHGAQVFDFVRKRRGRRIFATYGAGGRRWIWSGRAGRSKQNDQF